MLKPQLIGITGRKRSGKDTAADILCEQYGYVRVAFADKLRETCKLLFGLTDEELTDGRLKEQYLDRYPYESPREILQKVGTECMRAQYPDVWIEAFRAASEEAIKSGRPVVCSDVRFLNEALHLRSRGAVIIRVDADKRLGPAKDSHKSEVEMSQIQADITIPNNESQEKYSALCEKIFARLIRKDLIA